MPALGFKSVKNDFCKDLKPDAWESSCHPWISSSPYLSSTIADAFKNTRGQCSNRSKFVYVSRLSGLGSLGLGKNGGPCCQPRLSHGVTRAPSDLALLSAHFLEAFLRSFINQPSVPRKAVKSKLRTRYVCCAVYMRLVLTAM